MSKDRKTLFENDAGFTILELLAAVTILALAAGLAFPSLAKTRQNLRLNAVTADLAADLKIARAQALSQNRDTLFILDTGVRSYVSSGMSKKKIIPSDFEIRYQAKAIEQLSPTEIGFRFRPDGTTSGGSITLQSREQSAIVAIDWLTGAISTAAR